MSLSLSGIDADAVSVSVEITDGTNSVSTNATNDGSGWVVADQNLSTLDDGTLTVSATVTDQAGNSANVSTTLELDTVVVPPVTLLVSDAHADMTAAEAANAMTVTVEDGSAWTVTLTGTRNDAALIDQAAKESALDTAETELGAAVTDRGSKVSARDVAEADRDTAQSTYDALSDEQVTSRPNSVWSSRTGRAECRSRGFRDYREWSPGPGFCGTAVLRYPLR